MASFRGKMWERSGNRFHLVGTEVNVYQWNTGKKANFLVTGGYRNSSHIEKSFGCGINARDDAIAFALSIADKYRRES